MLLLWTPLSTYTCIYIYIERQERSCTWTYVYIYTLRFHIWNPVTHFPVLDTSIHSYAISSSQISDEIDQAIVILPKSLVLLLNSIDLVYKLNVDGVKEHSASTVLRCSWKFSSEIGAISSTWSCVGLVIILILILITYYHQDTLVELVRALREDECSRSVVVCCG